nr:toll/interleukin-1 receptor domain-containing protein [uncultured Rhodopila sp.]
MKVFVSYSHAQGDWVQDRLVPCLRAGGADVLIDVKRFRSGGGVYRQMDATQDLAERQVLVLSDEYLASSYCQHEMRRAIAKDPTFASHIVQPVLRVVTKLPNALKLPDPTLYVDLQDDGKPGPWDLLLHECEGTLGVPAPDWLAARDEIIKKLDGGQSVNFIVTSGAKWRELIEDVANRPGKTFPLISMNAGETASRRSLIETILTNLHIQQTVPPPPEDLPVLSRVIKQRSRTLIGLLRFDYVKDRHDYDKDLHGTLRNLVRDERKLVLLVQSHAPFADVLPGREFVSEDFLNPIFLPARP